MYQPGDVIQYDRVHVVRNNGKRVRIICVCSIISINGSMLYVRPISNSGADIKVIHPNQCRRYISRNSANSSE